MPYPLSNAGKAAFQSMARQTVSIAVTPVTGSAFTITEADIRQGGFVVDRFSMSGNTLELGSCCAAELELTIDNTSGSFDGVVFEGADMAVTVSCASGGNTYSVPMGYFTVDGAPKMRKVINLVALDRMVQFDKDVNLADFNFPMDVQALVAQLCQDCNVILSSAVDMTIFPNYDMVIDTPVEDRYTYREWLMWCCQLMGVCGYIDWDGELMLSWYATSASDTLTTSNRFSSDLETSAIVITGVRFDDGETEFVSGTDGYVFDISNNQFARQDPATSVAAIYGALGDTSYTPFTADVLPMPWVWPLDALDFTDADGNTVGSYVTHWTYTLNTRTSLKGEGQTVTQSGYAAANPLTARERMVITAIERKQNEAIDAATQNVLHFNELISNALGMYVTPVAQPGGGYIYYMHDDPDLTASSTIFTFTQNGIAWTEDGWNGGAPVWSYGVTAAGAALFNSIAANRVNADWIQTGILSSANGSSFVLNLDTGELNIDAMTISLNGTAVTDVIDDAVDPVATNLNTAQGDINSLKAHIEINPDGSVTFKGANGDPVTLTLLNDKLAIFNGSDLVAYFGDGGAYTPNLTIETGGSLTMGRFKWTPRSSGNLSLLYVGG